MACSERPIFLQFACVVCIGSVTRIGMKTLQPLVKTDKLSDKELLNSGSEQSDFSSQT